MSFFKCGLKSRIDTSHAFSWSTKTFLKWYDCRAPLMSIHSHLLTRLISLVERRESHGIPLYSLVDGVPGSSDRSWGSRGPNPQLEATFVCKLFAVSSTPLRVLDLSRKCSQHSDKHRSKSRTGHYAEVGIIHALWQLNLCPTAKYECETFKL